MEGVRIHLHADNWKEGVKFYTALVGREPDSIPDYGVAVWELVPKCTLHVIGNPAEPIRFAIEVADLKDVYDRVKNELGIEPEGTLWKYNSSYFVYNDPWGNGVGFYAKRASAKIVETQ